MPGPKTIRAAVPADAAGIKLVETESGVSPWTLADYEKGAVNPDVCLLVSINDGELTGFLNARLITKSNYNASTNEQVAEAEILNLAVVSGLRKKGLGTSLLTAFIEKLLEFKDFCVFLEVRESNVAAREFYRSNGFIESGKRVKYYRKPAEDAILMTLTRRLFQHSME